MKLSRKSVVEDQFVFFSLLFPISNHIYATGYDYLLLQYVFVFFVNKNLSNQVVKQVLML